MFYLVMSACLNVAIIHYLEEAQPHRENQTAAAAGDLSYAERDSGKNLLRVIICSEKICLIEIGASYWV